MSAANWTSIKTIYVYILFGLKYKARLIIKQLILLKYLYTIQRTVVEKNELLGMMVYNVLQNSENCVSKRWLEYFSSCRFCASCGQHFQWIALMH